MDNTKEETQLIAERTGAKTYTTYLPCERHHQTTRFTSSSDCVSCYDEDHKALVWKWDKVEIIQAMAGNKKSFASSVPCSQGHIGYRFTNSYACYHCWTARRSNRR